MADPKEKEVFKYGVKKEIIEDRISKYEEIQNQDLGDKSPITALNILEIQFNDLIKEEEAAKDDSEREEKLAKLKQKRKEIEEKVNQINQENKEVLKANDVIEELEDLLKTSKEEYSFVEIEEIEKRIEEYKKMLFNLDSSALGKRKSELEALIAKQKEELEKLKENAAKKDDKTSVEPGKEYLDSATEKAKKDLEDKIANREAMIAGRGNELNPARYEELAEWKKQLADLNSGKITDEIREAAINGEIKDLEDKIANREAMIAGRENELNPARYEELKAWKERLSALLNSQGPKELTEDDKKIAELEKSIAENEKELEEVNKSLEELEKRNIVDLTNQKRVIENRIEELEDLAKEKSLFKINEKGEVEIKYPDMPVEIDEQAIADEYMARRTDMLDKYYGNKEKSAEYKEKMQEFKSHIVEKEFEFVDKDGKRQTGVYSTVEPYEGMEDDLAFLQLEEYADRLERLTKYEAGDISAYSKFKNPEAVAERDKSYIETNNSAYNRLVTTQKNLMTLGKYGEKVPYSKMQEGQTVRNILRAVGNAGRFIRNHTTAPINKFIGSKIVAPIYGAVTGVNKGNVAGLYSNKFTHRYVARREYFASQGKGYFASRFNSIFKAKEGNKAILSAGAHDIKESIKTKYTDQAIKAARQKQIEFAGKSIEEQMEMLKEDLDKTTDPQAKAKLENTLEILKKAEAQIKLDKEKADNMKIRQTIQTDAVDMDQHDKANKENVTRTVTGIKMLTRFGIKKFVGPKIKQWLVEHTQKQVTVPEQYQEPVQSEKWVETTYKEQTVPVYGTKADHSSTTLEDIMSSNAGKQVEGYYSVYGGETRPKMYDLTGNEKITAVFQGVGNKGTGLSDTAGLTAPTLTDRAFDASFLGTNGVLKQDVTVEQIINAIGADKVNPDTLSDLYVSVGDKCWVKLTDLYDGLTKTQIGTEVKKVIDVPGHMEKVTEMVTKTRDVTKMVENTRVTSVLDKLGIAYDVGASALLVDDIYENARKTKTNVRRTKPQPRNYDYEAGYVGKKQPDYEADLEVVEIKDGVLRGGNIIKDDIETKTDKKDKTPEKNKQDKKQKEDRDDEER